MTRVNCNFNHFQHLVDYILTIKNTDFLTYLGVVVLCTRGDGEDGITPEIK